ncbi:hypothetical protein QAD02_017066 [Eretmocerus hayati]|uniref:Uncharacterized protein n=1 Tax=Eretmocerus hayati TaxID=131215 RepID=A0ACC2PCC5_9HYME|nr:hypothetical protein QAD02_017066 [Eretmocerus hayati]
MTTSNSDAVDATITRNEVETPNSAAQHKAKCDVQPDAVLGEQQSFGGLSVLSSRSVCRICHTGSGTKEPLVSPCRCKGTLANVHVSCLERWLNQSCRNYCELCNFRYNALETQRYKWLESLRIWINHPRNRRHIKEDFLIFMLLTVFTAGLASICVLETRHIVIEGVRSGFSEAWTKAVIAFFMFIVFFGYGSSVYFIIKRCLSLLLSRSAAAATSGTEDRNIGHPLHNQDQQHPWQDEHAMTTSNSDAVDATITRNEAETPNSAAQHKAKCDVQPDAVLGEQQSFGGLSVLSSRSVCRICHTGSGTKEPLVSPCRCKGTLANVHVSCLERWLNQSCRNYCELCNFRYNALETQRYKWFAQLSISNEFVRSNSHDSCDTLRVELSRRTAKDRTINFAGSSLSGFG